jgi:hypothetical protein
MNREFCLTMVISVIYLYHTGYPAEDIEGKVKYFVKSELGIEDEINFDVVHRLKPKQDRSPRGIVTKFERRKDRNKVLSKAIAKLKNSKQFIVHEQYPI